MTQLIDLLMWQKKEQLTAEDIEKLYKKIAIVQYDSKSKLHAFKLDHFD